MIPFPYRDENPAPSAKAVLLPLIAANIIVFAWEAMSPLPGIEIARTWGFMPSNPEPRRWLSSMFLHAGVMHLAGNMWFLWLFGDNVEGRLKRWFLPFYIVCGVGANLWDFLVRFGSDIPAVGASGAISGVLGAYFVLFPTARLQCVWYFGFFWRRISLSARAFGFVYVAWQFFMMWVAASFGVKGGTAYAAHLGGAVFGALIALWFQETPQEAIASSGPAGAMPAARPPRGAWPMPSLPAASGVSGRAGAAELESFIASDPASAVAGFRSRLRKDPYFALPAESQYRMSLLLLKAGQPHFGRMALSKLLLREPEAACAGRARLELARVEEDWFRDFAAARRSLLKAKAQAALLDRDEAREVEERLKRCKEVLDETFAEAPAEGERYWVLRESASPMDATQVRWLAKLLGEPAERTLARLAQDPGVLARDVGRADAALIADNMETSGVPVLVLSQRSLLLLPPPELAVDLRAGPAGPSPAGTSAGGGPAGGVASVPAGVPGPAPGAGPVVTLQDGRREVLPWAGVALLAAAGLRVEGRDIQLIEVFTLDPLRRLRWWQPEPDEARYFGRLQELLVEAPNVPVNAGAVAAWDGELPESCVFTDPAALDRSLSWELQLAYQRKEGFYRARA